MPAPQISAVFPWSFTRGPIATPSSDVPQRSVLLGSAGGAMGMDKIPQRAAGCFPQVQAFRRSTAHQTERVVQAREAGAVPRTAHPRLQVSCPPGTKSADPIIEHFLPPFFFSVQVPLICARHYSGYSTSTWYGMTSYHCIAVQLWFGHICFSCLTSVAFSSFASPVLSFVSSPEWLSIVRLLHHSEFVV